MGKCNQCGIEQNYASERETETRFPPHVRRTLATTDSGDQGSASFAAPQGGRVTVVAGWSCFAFGTAVGWEKSFDNGRSWESLVVGEEIPPDRMGNVFLRAPAGATGSLILECAPPEADASLRSKAAAAASGSGAGTITTAVEAVETELSTKATEETLAAAAADLDTIRLGTTPDQGAYFVGTTASTGNVASLGINNNQNALVDIAITLGEADTDVVHLLVDSVVVAVLNAANPTLNLRNVYIEGGVSGNVVDVDVATTGSGQLLATITTRHIS